MGEKGRILFFYPHNFTELASGTHRRAAELLEYFRERGLTVDIFSLDGFTNRWSKAEDASSGGLFRALYLYPWRRRPLETARAGCKMLSGGLPDYAFKDMRRRFAEMARRGGYSCALVSYVYWAGLGDGLPPSMLKVIDLHDFITLLHCQRSGKDLSAAGRMLREEVRAIDKFDYALSISQSERRVLEPLCERALFVDAPASFPERFQGRGPFAYDLLFVGSADNVYNREGMAWFTEKVFPALSPKYTLAVAGNICRSLKEAPNLRLLHYVEDLAGAYRGARAVICPVLGGTGLKIKLVEALSFGRPVVTTPMGVSGIDGAEGGGCLVADGEKAFARAVDELLSHESYYERVRAQGMEFFKARFSRSACWKNLDRVFPARGQRG